MAFTVTREFADSFLQPMLANNPGPFIALCTPATRIYWGTVGPLAVPEFVKTIATPMTELFQAPGPQKEYTSITIDGSRIIVEMNLHGTMLNGEEYKNKIADFFDIDGEGKIAEWRVYNDVDMHYAALAKVAKWREEQK